jgi:hypothetical protein
MKPPFSYTFFFWLALSMDAFCQTVAQAQVPSPAPPAGGAATGVFAATLPVEQHMGGSPEQTRAIALAAGIAGFAAAAAGGSTSANH